jgi:hypothetical protein
MRWLGCVLCRFVVVPPGMAPGSLLAKLLRAARDNTEPDGAPYPRVLVFAADSESADKLATALRAAVWEEYRIGLVLPGGEFPTKMLQVRPMLRASACIHFCSESSACVGSVIAMDYHVNAWVGHASQWSATGYA